MQTAVSAYCIWPSDSLGRSADGVRMSAVWLAVSGILAGMLGAMGMGGGGVLIIYLTLVHGIAQHTAQGINLLLFIPCACLALVSYFRKKLIDVKSALPAILCGLAGAAAGSLVSSLLSVDWLRRGFGVFLFLIALREIFQKPKSKS